MPPPEMASQLQKFLGMVTYLSPFVPSPSSFMAPLCGLLKKGLGAVLLQDRCPIIFASKPLTPTEQHYANIECELLACIFGMEQFCICVFGCKFIIESDHRPIEQIMLKNLADAPAHLQQMLLCLQFASALFVDFAADWKFDHCTSTPTNPHSNGQAEAAVEIVKRILTQSKYSGQDPTCLPQ